LNIRAREGTVLFLGLMTLIKTIALAELAEAAGLAKVDFAL